MNQPTDTALNRRLFLSRSAAALAASSVAGFPSIGRGEGETKMLKIALVGCGGRGSGAAGQALNADKNIQLVQWLFRNDTEADCPAQLLIDFDHVITREDKDMLEATDPDALVDTRRRGVEFSMDSDRPGMLIRKKLMELLAEHGEVEVHG